ncbi:MAG TPA: serine hydrolase, partial [Pyrinomonadaceae bacterium]|nr:serine hydrolase [Pyrinomonadaceae bacterium]
AAAAGQVADRPEVEIVKPKNYRPLEAKSSPELQAALTREVNELIKARGGGIVEDDISVTLIDLTDPANFRRAEYRGEVPIYPASVVKMFYLAAVHNQVEDGKIRLTPELERGLKDMIVTSSNEATQYIVDVLTDTASGSELPDEKMFAVWSNRRNRMNRYFASMGYTNINVNQKTHCEDAYGIEQQFRNYKGDNRNMITSNASARLIAEIALGRLANAERTALMMKLLERDPFADEKNANSQATDFAGKALIDLGLKDAKLWSKAGWVSRNRHDAAYVEMPDGKKFAVAVYTSRQSNDKDLIPAIVKRLISIL